MRRLLVWLLIIGLLAVGVLAARDYIRRHPQDVPWTGLELGDPVGLFTVRKLAALGDRPAQCRALLAEAGVGDRPAPPKSSGVECGYSDGVRLTGEGRTVAFAPAGLVTSCPVAAAGLVRTRRAATRGAAPFRQASDDH